MAVREIDDSEIASAGGEAAATPAEPNFRASEDRSMQALAERPPEIPRRDTIPGATGGFIERGTFMAAGGMGGAALGVAGGPPGMAVGGALGTAGGSLAYDLAENIARKLGARRLPAEGPFDPAKRAVSEGGQDLALNMLIPGAGALKRGVARALGVRGQGAQEAQRSAEEMGVELGAAHITESGIVKGAAPVLGVFPYSGGPFRTGQARVIGQLDDAAADMLNTLAPTATTFTVSKALTEGATRRFDKFSTVSAALYGRFNKLADALPPESAAIVPTAPVREQLGALAERAAREQITLRSGDALQMPETPVEKFVAQLHDLPERITVEQARGLERELNALVRRGRIEGFDVYALGAAKRGLEAAKQNLDLGAIPAEQAAELLGAWTRANDFYANAARIFESPTARKFERVDRGMFTPGIPRPGTLEMDDVFDKVFRARSPQALDDLERLAGRPAFQLAARKFLDQEIAAARIPAPEGSMMPDLLSAAALRKSLGLGTAEGQEVLARMLRGSNVHPSELMRLLTVAENATNITIRNPSTFLTRRLMLGGAIAGGLVLGAGHVTLPAALLFAYAARKGAQGLMSPVVVRSLTQALDPSTPGWLQRSAILRVLEYSGGTDDARALPERSRGTLSGSPPNPTSNPASGVGGGPQPSPQP